MIKNIQEDLFHSEHGTSTFALAPDSKVLSPFPMQYLGGKGRISNWIIQNIKDAFPACSNFLDLFSGTGIVALCAKKAGFNVLVNDHESYSYAILKGIFSSQNVNLKKVLDSLSQIETDKFLLRDGRGFLHDSLDKEKEFFDKVEAPVFKWERYRDFCQKTPIIEGHKDEILKLRKENRWNLFSRYYANTYFGVRQCLELDSIREMAEKNPEIKTHLLAATISAMTYGVSSTTHLAQFLKPRSFVTARHLIKRRKFNFVDAVKQRLIAFAAQKNSEQVEQLIFQYDFRKMLSAAPLNKQLVIYADPPYFKEHYSRYYHVLNTFCLYDYPYITYNNQLKGVTEGRYREGRNVSDFGKKSLVRNAFRDLIAKCAETKCKLALSYAETSLVKKDEIVSMADELNLSTEIIETELMHSSQGQSGRTKRVCEYLFLIQ